jgi:hypothetical protein
VFISPNVQGVIRGHLDHEQVGNGLGGDIIPEFAYQGRTYSKNLDLDLGNGFTGRRLLANGCNMPERPNPTPTPTPPPPGATPTPTPPPPGATPTPTPPGATPTPPGATPTPPGATPTPPGTTPTPPPITPYPTPPPPEPVPEPITILLFGSGLASVGLAARKKFGKKQP